MRVVSNHEAEAMTVKGRGVSFYSASPPGLTRWSMKLFSEAML
jgi:hypothetical protein